MKEKINIIIPLNGLGTRFKENFCDPKPLIKILNKEMIFWLLDNLNYKYINKIIIPYNHLLEKYNFEEKIKNRYKNLDFIFFKLLENTKGAAETINIALNNISDEELKYNFMCMDCDTFYFEDVIQKYIKNKNKNTIFYFKDYQEKPIFSYIKINKNIVFEIEEKQKISNFANCGIFCFESGFKAKKYLKLMLENNIMQKNEFYISGMYKIMIEFKELISALETKNFYCVGTPEQLENFINKMENK